MTRHPVASLREYDFIGSQDRCNFHRSTGNGSFNSFPGDANVPVRLRMAGLASGSQTWLCRGTPGDV